MVTEERNLIYGDQHTKKLRDIYYQHYSVERLRRMVENAFWRMHAIAIIGKD